MNREIEDDIYDEAYHRRLRAEMIPDGGSVRVPLQLMDGMPREVVRGYSLADARRQADEARAEMIDRMCNPKNYDQNGRRVVDGIADDLTDDELYTLAERLAPMLALGPPNRFVNGPPRTTTDARPRRPEGVVKIRDRAEAIRLRDETHALMVDRMRNPKNYDQNGRRIAS
jgi:hypothetical protein